mmetsp:Transcript_49623/g.78925  ORF Transcript_49623/g.78925 Transcript_49623/m.78925 type:complete len:238 (+) Transcript_49623:588-1301(+)
MAMQTPCPLPSALATQRRFSSLPLFRRSVLAPLRSADQGMWRRLVLSRFLSVLIHARGGAHDKTALSLRRMGQKMRARRRWVRSLDQSGFLPAWQHFRSQRVNRIRYPTAPRTIALQLYLVSLPLLAMTRKRHQQPCQPSHQLAQLRFQCQRRHRMGQERLLRGKRKSRDKLGFLSRPGQSLAKNLQAIFRTTSQIRRCYQMRRFQLRIQQAARVPRLGQQGEGISHEYLRETRDPE